MAYFILMKKWMFLFCFFVLTHGASLLACPGCRDSNTQSVENNMKDVQAGFSWSVLFLMAMPLSLISGFVFWIVRLEKEKTDLS